MFNKNFVTEALFIEGVFNCLVDVLRCLLSIIGFDVDETIYCFLRTAVLVCYLLFCWFKTLKKFKTSKKNKKRKKSTNCKKKKTKN